MSENLNMKCDKCKNKKGHILGHDEVGSGNLWEHCDKGHWDGGDLDSKEEKWKSAPDPWADCLDFNKTESPLKLPITFKEALINKGLYPPDLKFDPELAHALSVIVHNRCPEAPHDIGVYLAQEVERRNPRKDKKES